MDYISLGFLILSHYFRGNRGIFVVFPGDSLIFRRVLIGDTIHEYGGEGRDGRISFAERLGSLEQLRTVLQPHVRTSEREGIPM